MITVAVLAAASLGTAAWGVYDAIRAHDCLNSGYSAGITERGCVLHTDHGTVLIALHGPGFGPTLLAIAASTVLVTVLVVLIVVRVCRVSGRLEGAAPTLALTLGLASIPLGWLLGYVAAVPCGALALILGSVALQRTRQDHGQAAARKRAIGGLVAALVGIAIPQVLTLLIGPEL